MQQASVCPFDGGACSKYVISTSDIQGPFPGDDAHAGLDAGDATDESTTMDAETEFHGTEDGGQVDGPRRVRAGRRVCRWRVRLPMTTRTRKAGVLIKAE